MLKNIKTYILAFLAIGLVACSNDDVEPLFDTDVDTRVNTLLDGYRKTLVESEFGWKTRYQPEGTIGAYNIYLKFNEDNSVEITSDLLGGINDYETSYRVGIAQFPELVFENYSTFHFLFESNGFSLGAEFEFIFEEVTDDTITFRSKTDSGDKSTIVFEKATSSDKEAIENIRNLYPRVEDGFNTPSFLRNLVVLNSSNEITYSATFTFLNDEFRRGNISEFDSTTGELNSTIHPLAVTEAGFDLLEPLVVDGNEISSFTYDEINNVYTSQDGGVTTIIGYDLAPITTGLVPALFSDDVDGFGVDFGRYLYFDNSSGNFLAQTSQDFLNLGKRSGFRIVDIIFDDARFPGSPTSMEFVFNGSSIFAIFDVQRIEGERIIFSYLGATADITPILNTLILIVDANGWYVQGTDESRFINNPSFSLTNVTYPNYRFSVYGI
ncbi:DUF4302 domain-containing protein [Aquimarina sp. MMG016]|uniref:DUF4302 domain-containing protein n=1 Tax=Aquimarina sp. MMG016 TaxID=2822690 RepID=UPI001B39DF80|nr:DUF4302 domain-containing protein [Aquimarina sp. MMG016]MBQ4821825.1 DUF4302 domain-containing protein [Aquimarina sp. MMG016]